MTFVTPRAAAVGSVIGGGVGIAGLIVAYIVLPHAATSGDTAPQLGRFVLGVSTEQVVRSANCGWLGRLGSPPRG